MPETRKQGRHFYVKGVLDPNSEYPYRYPDIPVNLYNGVDSESVVESMRKELNDYDVEIYSHHYRFVNVRMGYIGIYWYVGDKFVCVSKQIHQLELCVI